MDNEALAQFAHTVDREFCKAAGVEQETAWSSLPANPPEDDEERAQFQEDGKVAQSDLVERARLHLQGADVETPYQGDGREKVYNAVLTAAR